MNIAVLKYPGGHGDAEIIQVLRQYFEKDVREIWHKENGFSDVDILFIGGGFPCKKLNAEKSCMDDSPALQYLHQFAALGKYIVGFGNGFHFLCEVGLLPGYLENNASGNFICKQVYLKPENHLNMMSSGLQKGSIMRIPIATEYGRYIAEESDLVKMRRDGQIIFRYCDNEGRISEAINYTGSIDNIAGVCNASKNVFGMIPQPERAVTEFWDDADGKTLLDAFLGQKAKGGL